MEPIQRNNGFNFPRQSAGFFKSFFVLLLCIQFFFSPDLKGEVIDRVLAVVNGEIITESELEAALIPLELQYEQTVKSKRELRQKLKEAKKLTLEQLIENKILLQKAQEEKIQIAKEEKDKLIEDIKRSFATPEKFKEWLKAQQLTERTLKERLIEREVIRKLINKELRPGIQISPEEVKKFYEDNKEKFKDDAQVSLGYILIKGPPEREESEAEILISQVWAKLSEGMDFNLLVKEYSDGPKKFNGGEWGFVNIQTLPPELRELVEKLEVGEISEIIRTPSGFNVLKLTGKKDARQQELSEVEDLIEEQIFRSKLEIKYQPWLDELKEEAYIERK